MSWQKMVHTTDGKYVELKVGFGNIIYLNKNNTGYKVGNDNKIYTSSGRFVSKLNVEEFCKSQGFIRWFFYKKYPQPKMVEDFLFFYNYSSKHSQICML